MWGDVGLVWWKVEGGGGAHHCDAAASFATVPAGRIRETDSSQSGSQCHPPLPSPSRPLRPVLRAPYHHVFAQRVQATPSGVNNSGGTPTATTGDGQGSTEKSVREGEVLD